MKRALFLVAVLGVACAERQVPARDSIVSAASRGAPPHVAADVHFMQGMIGHHAQALAMVAMVPTHAASERIQLFAKKVDLSQRDEIGFISRWLADHGETVPAIDAPIAHPMPGMLTAVQMTQLDRARGTVFDSLFLTFMIQHHEGALTMVADLFAAPGAGQAPDLFQFATDVDNDQRAEIDRMQQMLYTSPASGSTSR
jgi:uncharacterized protein (DUF305 family)